MAAVQTFEAACLFFGRGSAACRITFFHMHLGQKKIFFIIYIKFIREVHTLNLKKKSFFAN